MQLPSYAVLAECTLLGLGAVERTLVLYLSGCSQYSNTCIVYRHQTLGNGIRMSADGCRNHASRRWVTMAGTTAADDVQSSAWIQKHGGTACVPCSACESLRLHLQNVPACSRRRTGNGPSASCPSTALTSTCSVAGTCALLSRRDASRSSKTSRVLFSVHWQTERTE